MPKALIKISYRQIIGASTEGSFAKNILKASYEEFKMKSQTYNMQGKFKTFSEMKSNDGRANSLHYKCGFAIGGYIELLKNKIPVLEDAAGAAVSFDVMRFEMIESDISNELLHTVAIHYISNALVLFDIIGDNLLLTTETKLSEAGNESVETFTLQMKPGLSIINYKELPVNYAINSFLATSY